MDNKPTTPNDQSSTPPVMDVKAPSNVKDVSMADEGAAGANTQEVAPAGTPSTTETTVSKDGQAAANPVPIKKSGKKGKVLLIMLIAIVLAAAAVYLYLNKKDDTAVTTAPPAATTETTAGQDTQDAVSAVDETIQASDNAGDTTNADLTDATLGL